MEAFIAKLITMSLQAIVAILVIIAARFIFGLLKIPKKYAYLLWIIPFIRLGVPFAIESELSIIPENLTVTMEEGTANDEYIDANVIGQDLYPNSYPNIDGEVYGNDLGEDYYTQATEDLSINSDITGTEDLNHMGYTNNYDNTSNELENSMDNDSSYIGSEVNSFEQSGNVVSADTIRTENHRSIVVKWGKPLFIIWLIGVIDLILISLISYIKLRKRLIARVAFKDNVYMSDYIDTAFVIGTFKPYICIPSNLEGDKQKYVIAHENYHIKRRDYLAKTVYFIITIVHWFNPLVWLAYFLMERDMEMSCDEAVLYKIGLEKKKDYASTLLSLSADRRNPISMPIAFGEGGTKGRIKNIMKSKKPLVVVIVVAIGVIVGLGLVLLTDPKDRKDISDEEITGTEGEASTEEDLHTENMEDNIDISSAEDEEGTTLVSGKYRYVPEGETLEEAMLYAPYIIINTELQEISIVEGAGSHIIQYGKYTVYDETDNLSFWAGGDMYYYFKIVDGNLVMSAESTDISYVKETGGEYYDVPEGGVFEFVPDSEFDVGDLFEGYSNVSFDKEYEEAVEVEITPPEYVEFQGLGADGPVLDYADMKFIIFHGYAGLYVYDRVAGGIRGAINLEAIGCHYTQGDNACQVTVGNNGYRVYLTTMNSDIAYVYDVQYNQLFQVDKAYVEEQERTRPTLVTDEVFEDDYTTWQSYNCVEITDGNTTYYGCLFSGSGLWEDISFSERNEEGRRRFNLIRDYYDLIDGEERRTRLSEIEENRGITLVQETPDYDLYDEVIENHNIAREQAWDAEDMERNGLVAYYGVRFDGYARMDITGDGVEELIVGFTSQNQNIILGVYTIKDGKVEILLSGAERYYYYLCENNVILHVWANTASNSGRQFFYLDEDGVTFLEGIICDGNYSGRHMWYYSTNYNSYHSYQGEPVTEEYAMDVLDDYSIRNINYTNFASTEISETIPYFSPEEDEAKNAFGTMMEDWKSNPEVTEVVSGEQSSSCGYFDVDYDGVVELIIDNDKCMGIFKYEDGEIRRIYSGTYSVLLEDGTVEYYRPGGAPEHEIYKFFEYDGEEYVEKDSFEWYNNDEGGNSYTSWDDTYFHNGAYTTQEEWYSLRAPYMEFNYARYENMFVIYN